MFSLHLAQKEHPSKFIVKYMILMNCSMFARLPGAPRGRHERLKKRTKTAHKKTPHTQRTNGFFKAPGQASKTVQKKTRKRHPREATMTPRSGPGGAGSDPRGPKTTPPGADLAPKRLPEPSGEPFWPPRGWILAPPRLPVQALLLPKNPCGVGGMRRQPTKFSIL